MSTTACGIQLIRDYSRENCCNFRVQQFPRASGAPFARINDKGWLSSENSRGHAREHRVGGHNSLSVVVNHAPSMNYKYLHTRARAKYNNESRKDFIEILTFLP